MMHRLLRIPLRRYHIHKQCTSTKLLSNYTCKYFSTANIESHDNSVLNNETNLEYLPDGITRHVDFFGEAITFVNNVDCNSIQSIQHKLPTSFIQSQQSTGAKTQTPNIVDTQTVVPSSSSSPSAELSSDSIINATSSFDGMALCILSRGSANLHTGNDGDGPEARAFHSSAMAWSELIRCAWEWNCTDSDSSSIVSSPMLAVASVAPVLAQGGSHYVHRIDRLLNTTRDVPDTPPPSLYEMAQNAVSFRDAILPTASSVGSSSINGEPIHLVTPRERWHLHALHQLLHNNHQDAMGAYLRLLELYPGDLLGLSLALDVAHTIGDSEAACRAATSVSSYWTERDGGALRLQQSHPAQNMAASLISVGLSSSSSSSRASTAERLAEIAMSRDAEGSGGTSIWAISNCLASEGRSSEMTSKLSSYDGTQSYESCGYLHFNTRMKGYAGIALLDQKRNGADRSALAKYDGGFGNVLEYSGNTVEGQKKGGEEVCLREKRIPRSVKQDVAGAVGSMFTGWFGSSNNGDGTANQTQQQSDSPQEGKSQDVKRLKRRTVEDVVCWLPPSPLLLTHATALLLRLTLCAAIPESDDRWADMKVAWSTALKSVNNDTPESKSPVEFMPLAMVASSLVIDPKKHLLSNNKVSLSLQCAMQGLYKTGKLMKLGQLKLISTSALDQYTNTTSVEDEWREVMKLLAQARDSCQRWEMPTGLSSSTYTLPTSNETSSSPIGWDFDLRQFLEYPLNYAAMQVGDYESLCLARTICSEGTTLRSNCPEIWWRYSTVLEKLGDGVAAENARAASISLGSGEGGGKF